MAAVDKFEIHLEHDIDEQYQYEPGEALRGKVLLKLKEAIDLQAITIQIKGEASVSWEDETDRPFRADETYVAASIDLVDAGESAIKLEKGQYSYPLEYSLPDNLPSSFIGKFGSITYVVKATLKEDKRFGLSTTITSEPFLVLRKLDISKDQKLMMKREEKIEERFYGTFICLSGKVQAEIGVNKVGHLPGEDMLLDAEVINGSPRTATAVQAALIMQSTFHARNQTRRNVQIVNKKRDEYEMSWGDGRRWKKVRLTIPPYIPESRLDGCDIIDISYELEFKIEMAKKKEMRVTIPITIGTYDGSLEGSGGPGGHRRRFLKHGENPGDQNGDADQGSDQGDQFDMDMNDEEASKFRYPMNPGDTRKNPIFTSM